MSEETLDKDAVIASLLESVEILREEVTRVRTNNRILRRVHSALRSSVTSLQNQIELAKQNDELFKRFCSGEFDAKVTSSEDSGLLKPETQVEPLV
jgi:hypothetical protein